MNIAICFFGQVKNYNEILYVNYINNIEKQLVNHNINFNKYLITYNNTHFINPRNNENNRIDYLSIFNFHNFFQYKIIDIQTEIIEKIDTFAESLVESYGGCWGEHSILSTKYAIRQLYLLEEFQNLLIGTKYDKYIFTRPDLFFKNELKIDYLLKNIDITTTFFDNGNTLNDKFAILSYDGMICYTNRYKMITEKPKRYHSENFLKQSVDKCDVSFTIIDDFLFDTIRAGVTGR
jgi:hypothetical protein